ncbi:MAG: hypothetical protein J6R46_00515 [Clostridia bacterium]|nr:hypothetical protein [Clostridia bacterium]
MDKAKARHHAAVMLAGLRSAIAGAGATALLACSVLNFLQVPTLRGYAAVVAFVVALLNFCVAIAWIYLQGKGRKRKKKNKHL